MWNTHAFYSVPGVCKLQGTVKNIVTFAICLIILAINLALWAVLAAYVHYNSWMLWVAWKWRSRRSRPDLPLADWPKVTVQLPVYNEGRLVIRLLNAAAQLDYPADKLEIQLLDDSTDDTKEIAATHVKTLRQRGVPVQHICRTHRDGYKAGALRDGLQTAQGELVLILDADFEPDPGLIKRMLPWFSDDRVGMVQGRWGQRTKPANTVERCTAYWMERHFDIEQFARSRSNQFFHFNGSGGMWRRQAIDDAGGWSADTVCEDLDLSFRAWAKKWKFIYDDSIVVPADQPPDMKALRIQQGRWAKGTFQVVQKVLPELKQFDFKVRSTISLHLTGYLFPVLLMLIALLSGVSAWSATRLPDLAFWMLGLPILTFIGGLAFQVIYRWRVAGWRAGLVEIEAATVGLGLAPHIFRNMVQGLRVNGGEFKRTPKVKTLDTQWSRETIADVAIATVMMLNVVVAVYYGVVICVPLPLLAATGIYYSALCTAFPAIFVADSG